MAENAFDQLTRAILIQRNEHLNIHHIWQSLKVYDSNVSDKSKISSSTSHSLLIYDVLRGKIAARKNDPTLCAAVVPE